MAKLLTQEDKFIVSCKRAGDTWAQMSDNYKCEFGVYRSPKALRSRYARIQGNWNEGDPVVRSNDTSDCEQTQRKETVEYNGKDGSTTFDRIIEIASGVDITPEIIMKAHGLDTTKWKVIAYRNNFWQTQRKGGSTMVLYQSRLTVKPLDVGEISLDDVKKWFTEFENTFKPVAPAIIKQTARQLLEVNISDAHVGKMGWRGECGEDYDFKIASERFKYAIDDIISRVNGERVERILFPVGNDFFNSDTVNSTTTKGTYQQNDLRWQKMFKVGMELLIYGVDTLSKIAPVDAFYISANHDKMVSFYAACVLNAHFRLYKDVVIDTSATYRKYREYGNTLIGFSHGDEDKPRIMKLMQIEAREAWGRTMFHEMHTAHVHSENVKEDGGLIWRTTSSFTGSDAWHTESGYVGAIKKSQSFLYDREKGLTDILNTVI